MCTGCDTIKAILDFSQTRKIANLIYTHGKCKICRAKKARVGLAKKRDEKELKEKEERVANRLLEKELLELEEEQKE
jgi:hypothetical protein